MNHLFFMNDLKTFAKSDEEQEGLLTTLKGLNEDKKMEFSLEKCKRTTFKRGNYQMRKTSPLI